MQKSIEELQNNLQEVTIKLSETYPLISKLEDYEKIKSSLECCDREIAKFSPDLSQQVEREEKLNHQLTEIKNILPWLKNIVESRSNLNLAIQQKQVAEENLRSLDRQLSENKQHQEQFNLNLSEIEQTERNLSNKVNLEQANYERINKQIEIFEQKELNNQCKIFKKQLADKEAEFSVIEAQKSRLLSIELKQSQEDIERDIQRIKKELDRAKEIKKTADDNVHDYSERSQQLRINLKENQTIYCETEINLQVKSKELPEPWQENADSFDRYQLQKLQQQNDELVKYEQLAQQLKNARQSLEYLTQHIKDCQKQIEQLPIEAHCSSQAIEQELETTREEKNKIDREKSSLSRELDRLKDIQERYFKIERDKLEAERNSNLYKKLSDLLGKKGIQLHILRNAEKAIIEIANEILDSLSRGKIRLELRGKNEQNELQQRLKRIILVSHQEEFFSAFTNGYKVELIERASQVSLLESSF